MKLFPDNLRVVLILPGPSGLQLTEWICNVDLPTIQLYWYGHIVTFRLHRSDLGPEGWVAQEESCRRIAS